MWTLNLCWQCYLWHLVRTTSCTKFDFLFLQVNILKVIYFNCRERNEDMIDHCSYTNNLGSYESKA